MSVGIRITSQILTFFFFFPSDLKPENVLLGTDVCIHTKPDMPYVRTIEANSG